MVTIKVRVERRSQRQSKKSACDGVLEQSHVSYWDIRSNTQN